MTIKIGEHSLVHNLYWRGANKPSLAGLGLLMPA